MLSLLLVQEAASDGLFAICVPARLPCAASKMGWEPGGDKERLAQELLDQNAALIFKLSGG